MSVRTLVVYVPGLLEKPRQSAALLDKVRQELGAASTETWVYPSPVRPWTRGDLQDRCAAFASTVDGYWKVHDRPERMVLIGHSLGGIMVRYGYLLALGGLGGSRRDWAARVTRIVLLAAPNRGLDPQRMKWPLRWLVPLVGWLIAGFSAMDVRIGSAFMTNLRLEWIRRTPDLAAQKLTVVQVLGGSDRLVEDDDSRDIEYLRAGVTMDLPPADHGDIMRVGEDVEEDFPGQRWAILREAIIGEVTPVDPPGPDAASVVFVLHGIRAGNDAWVEALAGKLRADATARVVTASYGRLSAYNFALPITRRRTLRWFQDQYSYELAHSPQVPFHFVGHSNGTYVLGQSMRRVRALRFDRVYLAGSVLPRSFDWRACRDHQRLGTLVNVCANADKPVAWLCSMLRGLGMRDVGVGGFAGFDVPPDGTRQIRYLDGGHGAGVADDRLDGIAGYVLTGATPVPGTLREPSGWFAAMSRAAPYVAWALVLAVLGTVAYAVLAASLVPAVVLVAVLLLGYLTLKVV